MTDMPKHRGRSRGMARIAMGLAAAAVTSGCASLPSSGPTARDITRAELAETNLMGFRIVNVEPSTSPELLRSLAPPEPQFSLLESAGVVDAVGPGDVLNVNIFEVGPSLFSGGSGSAAGGAAGGFDPSARNQALQGVVVDRDGAIRLPYVGRIRVAGMTTSQIQEVIERAMRGMSQSPQALVSIRENVANTVVVLGAVQKPGRQSLTLARSRLLDAIAEAGGAGTQTQDLVVRFTRGGRSLEQPLLSIRSGEANDLTLLPGDRIELLRQPQSFTVFGATKVAQITFDARDVSLAEAIARAGGPIDTQADPTAIFVFRYARTADGTPAVPTDPQAAPQERPMIYRLNMMNPASYFLAQRFPMRDKDVIYIANARSNQPTKLVQIINLLFSPFFTAQAVARQ